jgi:ribosomal protein S18 acetylase RimI-like enzyme
MEINRLQPGDETLADKAIQILKTDGYPSTVCEPGYSYVVNFLENPSNYFIVATESGAPIGFVLAYELERLDRLQPMMLFYEINVLKSKRRQGIAKAMINLLKTICQERNILKMWVLTNKANQAAMRTYESTGGQLVKEDDMVMFVYYPEEFAEQNHLSE